MYTLLLTFIHGCHIIVVMDKALNINSYLKDGFKRVCDCRVDARGDWYYENMDESIMYSEHRSWIYFIVRGDEIVKVGETGNPLGLRINNSDQPMLGTKSRLGRYRKGSGTDEHVRTSLLEDMRKGSKVSIWARKCDMQLMDIKIQGKKSTTMTSYHKHLEMVYIDHIYACTGAIPELNKARK